MDQAQLRQYSAIHLLVGGMMVKARLEFAEAEQAFFAVLPGSQIFGPSEDVRLKLTDTLIQRIKRQPDGSLRLET